jgi:DNA-binding NarL/FixJ family response regulator
MNPRVFVVDDHAMVRAGVRAELGDDVTFVGEAPDVPTAVEGIRATRPDVVLLDVHLPGGTIRPGGREVLTRSASLFGPAPAGPNNGQSGQPGGAPGGASAGPAVRFLALSVSDAAEDVIAVIRAGARGYVTKSITGEELVAAVLKVAEGDAVFSPRLAGFVLDAFGTGAGEVAVVDDELDRLSAREREVMRLIARGYAYKEVARELFISVKTVETHVSAVLRKLQLSSRHELTRWAADRRLL